MENLAPRHVKDLVTGALAETFGDDLFAALGLKDMPSITGSLPTVVREVELQDWEMDYVFGLATGDRAHLEFQDATGQEALRRFLLYDALRFYREGRRLHTVVVYTGAVQTAPETLDAGSIGYRVRNVYLRAFDGEATLRALREKVDAGQRLSRREAVRLALVPLMRLGALSMGDAAAAALPLLRGLPGDRARAQLAATLIGLCARYVSKESLGRLIAMARTTTLFDDLLAEMVAKGKAEGEAEGEARAVLRVLLGRFGTVDSALTAHVLGQRDMQTLDRWLDLALAAASLAEFAHAVAPAR